MTEEEVSMSSAAWLGTGKPQYMLRTVQYKTTARKWLMMGSAFAKTCQVHLNHGDSEKIITACEQHAEGTLTEKDRLSTFGLISQFRYRPHASSMQVHCSGVFDAVLLLKPGVYQSIDFTPLLHVHKTRVERLVLCNLIRDIFGNPFRPATFAPDWRTEAAVGIASQMYDSRDFGNMPILADALQDAGCELPEILNHCREPGTHVRGCWVVDLVLGKS